MVAIIRFVASIGFFVLLTIAARAADTFTFGVLTAPPYGFESEDKSVTGSNHDIGELIAAKAGLKFKYHLEPLARLVSDMKAGKLDLMIMFPTDETKRYAIAEVIPNNNIVLPAPGHAYPHFEDLKGTTIAGLRRAVYDQKFAADEDIGKFDVDSYVMGLRMTKSGRVDGMIGPDFGLYFQMRQLRMMRQDFGPPLVLNTRMLHLLASDKLPSELVTKLKAVVEELRNSGAITAAAERYVK